ncbi:Plant self-incompatibility S1 [Spatholobus suberectus]|nr:Plant self-incompatibility S1 [Spatholobus suberectus]
MEAHMGGLAKMTRLMTLLLVLGLCGPIVMSGTKHVSIKNRLGSGKNMTLHWWENVDEYHFDAYSFARDRVRCDAGCSWLVSAESIYGLNGQTGYWEFIYQWPN